MKKLKEIKSLMKKYNLTVNDLPAFPQKGVDLKKLIVNIGEAKLKKKSIKK